LSFIPSKAYVAGGFNDFLNTIPPYASCAEISLADMFLAKSSITSLALILFAMIIPLYELLTIRRKCIEWRYW
jgi:hypothetical protein